MTYAISVDSDQTVHMHSLIRVYAARQQDVSTVQTFFWLTA